MIVNVEAPVGSFPSVAELRITPITTKSQQQQIKDQLVENTDVTEESELVSFDISFIYTLSNGEVIELQPYTWQTVKVSFNFTYNDTLSQADSDSDKELKVYHLEEVKDEEWRKTDEVEVKEIEVNKSESSEWELVVDAEKFSIYSVAGVELRAAAMCTVTFQNGHCYWVSSSQNNDDGVCTFDMPESIQVECGQTISRQDIDEPYSCSMNGSEDGSSQTWNYYFARWSTEPNPWGKNTSYNYDFSTPVTDDITLYAIWSYANRVWWSQNYYVTVTFGGNWWTPNSSSINYWYYGLVKQPTDPIRTWYMLRCWSTSQTDTSCNNAYNFNSTTNIITSNKNLYAQWESVSYTIKFHANGWNWSANDIDAGYGVSYSLPNDNFSRDWYVLYSWNTESDGSGTWYDIEDELINLTTVNGDIITLYAQWGIQNRVSFEGNWWTVSVPYIDVASWQTMEAPEDPTYDGYAFLWWYLTGATTPFNFSTPITSDIILYAHWEVKHTYTVTFNSNGWSSVESQEVEPGERAVKPEDPTKSNQWFKYWTTDSAWNNEYDFNTPVTDDLELFAQRWNVCRVTFNNGYCYYQNSANAQCTFSLTTTSVDVACGTPVERPEDPNSPITVRMGNRLSQQDRTIYFSKWTTRENPWYSSSNYDYDFSTPVTSDLDLYAIWYNSYFTVTFNANNGTLNWPSSVQVWQYTRNNNVYWWYVRQPDDPTRVWYDFKWWSTTQNNGSEFDFSTEITQNRTLYAQWTPITYTIKYNANGWVGNMSDTSMTYDTAKNLSSNTFTKSNATFSGWNTRADGAWTPYGNWVSVNNLTDVAWRTINLYAQWNCNNGYHDENGACVSSTKTVSCNTGSTPENATPTVVDVEITWNNGTWSSPAACAWNCNTGYTQSWNACVPASCSFQWQTIENGGSLTVYSNASPTCPTECTQWTVTCNNGILWWDTSYTNLSCATVSKTCDSSYTLSSEGSHGTYSSCTPSAANGTTCTAGTTVYKLDSCDSGYHTEDNATCVSNSKSVACDSDLVPVNSTAISGNVTITWNWTWNNGSWSATGSCDWTCNEHYHTWANNTSCELDTYQVTWKNRDNSTLKTDTVGYGLNPSYNGTTPTKPSDSTYRYVFNGWTPEISIVTGNTIYTATFKAHELSESVVVTFNTDGWSSIDPQVVDYWGKATKPSNPTKTWFAFDYWSTDSQGNNHYDFNTVVTSDLILYAQWTENICTVTFQNGYCYRNQGNDAWIVCQYTLWDPINVRCGSTISRSDVYEPAEPFTTPKGNRTYYFARWSTEPNPWLDDYSTTFDFSTPITGDIILYAIWWDPSYDVTFNGNGWNPSTYKVTVGVYGLVRRPADPVREGYTLLCWSESQSDTSCNNPYDFDDESNRILNNKTLYAQWAPITYTIRYDANGWEWSMADTNMTYNTPVNLRPNTFTKANATFVRWNTKADESWTWYSDEQSVINLSTTQWSLVRLYALWNCNDWYMWSWDVCVAADCTFQWQTILNGASLTVYSSAAPTCPTTCTQWTVTCTDWVLWWDTSYTNLSCTPQEVQCSSLEYPIEWSCPAHWVCTQSCTPYTVDGNVCTQWTVRYQLNGCDTHYHINGNICELDTYTIDFVNRDWTVLQSSEFDYWTTPVYNWSTPTSGSTVEYNYTFKGWDKEIVAVTEATTYTATYNSIPREYTISFVNYNGTELLSWKYEYWTLPEDITRPSTPSKPSTAKYSYTFSGWNPEVSRVVWAQVYTATYKSSINEYTITWKDGDGNTIKTEQVPYDEVPSYTWTTPTKTRTQQYSYIFNNTWTPTPVAVTWDFVYTANFDEEVNQYTATIIVSPNDYWTLSQASVTDYYWSDISVNWNVLTISWTNVTATPTPADPEWTYKFDNWTITDCWNELTDNCNITANFSRTKNTYEITFNSNWWSAVASQTKEYGATVDKPTDPTKDGYDFAWWYSNEGLTLEYNFTESVTSTLALYAKWTPKNYTISYTLNWWTVSSENPTSYTIESDAITLNNPTKVWYEFLGWTGNKLNGLTKTVTIPTWSTGNRTYVANWEAVDVTITINHYTQDLVASTNQLPGTYTKISTTTDEAPADSMVQLQNYKLTNIEWFTYSEWKVSWETVVQTRVLPEWTLVIDLYYTRNSNTFTLITDAGSLTNGTSPSWNYYYGATITLSGSASDCYKWNRWGVNWITLANNQQQTTFSMPDNNVSVESLVTEKTYNIAFNGTTKTSWEMSNMENVACTATVKLPANGYNKTWYTFTWWAETEGWNKKYGDEWSVTTLTTEDNWTVTLYAVWEANKNTPYTVNHWYLGVNGERTSDKTVDNLSWTTNTKVTPAVKWREWFNSPTPAEITISPEGNTVLDYEYTRKSYTLTFNSTGTIPNSRGVIYGWLLNVDETSSKDGYTFLGWTPDPVNMTMPLGGLTLSATWRADTVGYKVEHYQQNIDNDNYTFFETGDKTWITDTTWTAEPNTYVWFTYNPSAPWTVTSGNIAGNGSLVLRLYYTRNTHTISFNENWGSEVADITKKYWATIPTVTNPTRDWYSFSGWNENIPTTMPDEDMTITAQWTPVEYHLSYTLNSGSLDEWVTNPETYTIESDPITLNNPKRVGYTFLGWTTEWETTPTINVTIPTWSTGNRTYVANWEADNNITVTVNHYVQDLNIDSNEVLNTYIINNTTTYNTWTSDARVLVAWYQLDLDWFSYNHWEVNGTTVEDTIISPYGTTVINLYYTRDQYSFTLTTPTGSSTNGTSPSGQYYYWAKVTLSWDVSSDCYIWNQWNVEWVSIANNKQTVFYMPANSVTAQPSVTEKTYNIAFNGTTKTSWEMSNMENVACTATVKLPANGYNKTWYTFTWWAETEGWNKKYGDEWSVTTLTTGNNETVTLYAVWEANTDTKYVVKHLKQNINNDNYEEVVSDRENLTGITDENATVTVKPYVWFEVWVYTPATIKWDESTVIEVRYARKNYTITFNENWGSEVEDITAKYEAAIDTPTTPTKQGYEFSGWNPSIPDTMPAYDQTIDAQWRPANVNYTVEHHLQSIDDENVYVVSWALTETEQWKTESQTQAAAKNLHWFTAKSFDQQTIAADGSTVVVIEYTRDDYTISFNSDWGSAVSAITAKYQSWVAAPANPKKTWHTFAGWYDWDEKVEFPYTVEDDITLTAHWTVNQYIITFDSNGWSAIDPIEQNYGTTVTAPANPTREGYTFDGWQPSVPTTMPAENTTVVAQWNINSYKIRFVDWSGSIATEEKVVVYSGSTSTITYPEWEKEGYTLNWNGSIPAKMPAHDVIITGNWTINQYTITFNTTWSAVAPITQNYNTTIDEEPVTEQHGYTFDGWYDGENLVTFPYTIPATNKTLTAHWTINQYTITFDSMWWSSVASVTQDYNTEISKPTDPTRDGYTFAWWFKQDNTKVIFPYTIKDNETLHAKWNLDTYTINYELNWWSVSSENPDTYTVESDDITLNNPTRRGYNFLWWTWTDESTYNSGVVIAQWSVGDRTYVANWEPIEYTIWYTLNWWSVSSENPTSYTIESADITLNNPTRAGYNFLWWTWTNVSTYNSGVVITQWSIGNRTYVANWEAKTDTPYKVEHYLQNLENDEYTLHHTDNFGGTTDTKAIAVSNIYEGFTYNSEIEGTVTSGNVDWDGSLVLKLYYFRNTRTIIFDTDWGNTIPSITDKYGASITKPANPTKDGYDFAGWDKAIPDTMPDEEIIIKASWTPHVYSISYTLDGGELAEWVTNPETYTIESNPITLNNPTKEGYTFLGWTLQWESTPSTNVTIPTWSTWDRAYVANWSINQYTITFNSNWGSEVSAITQDYNTDVTRPADPTKNGYTFGGWQPSVPATMPAENTTVVAQWNIETYNITYNLDGGELAQWVTNPETYTVETNTFRLNNPSKTGYDFVGWDDWKWNISDAVDVVKWSTGNRNYTATYNVHKWQLTFKSDNEVISSEQVAYGSELTAPADPVKYGYTFKWWNPSVPATMPDNNLTINAVWEVNKHNVTYVSEGQTFEEFTNIAYGSDIPTTWWTPTKVWHHFVEWTWSVALTSKMPDNDVTYTAVFEKNDYVVELSVNYATWWSVTWAWTYKYDDPITVVATENYWFTFSGWKVGDEFVSKNASYTFRADEQAWISLVAIFDINSYEVSATSSSDVMWSVTWAWTYEYATQVTLTATANQWYHFVEWRNATPESVSTLTTYTITVREDTWFVAVFEPNTNTQYRVEHYRQNIDGEYPEEASEVEPFEWTTASTITPDVKSYEGFTAPSTQTTTIAADGSTVVRYDYTRNSYTITFDPNWGSEVSAITKKFEESFTKPSDPTREGYSFDGWDKNIPSTMPAINQTITAKWKINQYTITFDTDGGTTIDPITQDYNTAVTAPANPTKEGYTFDGWDKAIPSTMPAINQTITAQWIINQYTITFDSNWWTPVAAITQDYNTDVTRPADPTRAWYHFDGWNVVVPTKMPANDMIITWLWTANTDTPYKVEHYKQNITDNDYTLFETEDKTWTTDQQTQAVAKSYDWFTAPQTINQVNIDWDGNAVVEIRYIRNSYELSFDTDWWTSVSSKTLKYEEDIPTIETPIKTWYHLSEDVHDAWIGYPVDWKMPFEALELKANWKPNTNTPYKVEHYLQNLDKSYPEQPYETEDKTGTTDSEVTPDVKTNYNGYKVPSTQTVTIAADGSTVVKYEYARETYTITYDVDWGTAVPSEDVIFGWTITQRASTKVWYDFGGWAWMPTVMPDHDLNVKAIWKPSQNTPYKTQYYLEKVDLVGNIEQDYVLEKEEAWTWTTNSPVTPTVYEFTGFISPASQTENIKADGSLVIKYYYTRSGFELSYDPAWWTEVPLQIVRYGAAIHTWTTTRTWYTFIGWDNEEPTMPHHDLRLVALWDPNDNTPYKVEHYIQNLDLTGYDLHYTKQLSGTTDTPTAAKSIPIPWFSVQPFEQVNIDWDWQAVVEIKYNRNSYDITYVMNGGDSIENDRLKYEEPIQPTLDQLNPHRLWYNFVRWLGLPEGMTMPATGLILNADWEARNDTKYIVRHFKEKVAEWRYDDPIIEELTWYTDSEARPNPKTYMWFITPSVKTGTIIAVPEWQTGLVIDYYYNRDSFTLTYDVDGWETIENNPRPVRYGVTIDTWVTTTKVWYIFRWWSNVPADGTMPAEALTIKAIWEPDDVNYTVEHHFQNVEGTDYVLSWVLTETKQWKTESQTQAVAKNISWFTAQTISQKEIAPDGSTVVVIKYDRNPYTIRFNENWGSEVADITDKYEAPITAPADPTKEGYTFNWWNPEVPATMPAKDIDLDAQWLNNVYTVSFNANGWEWITSSVSATYDVPFTLTANGFSRLWYTFSGWALTDNGPKVYGNQQVVTDKLTAVSWYNVVLYAVWDLNTYTIKYTLNGGSVEWENPTSYNVTSDNITLINPTRDWYDFLWWTWTDVSTYNSGVVIVQWSVGNRTYVANWKPITYTITYDVNGWDDVINPETYTIETNSFTLNNPTRAWYTFLGWTGNKLPNISDNVIISKWSTGDRNYIANWKANDNTKYIVRHYQQNINDDQYSLVETQELTWTTDTSTQAEAKSYVWFTAKSFQQKTIKADDSDSIDIYYDRINYTISVDWNRWIESVAWVWSYKYGKDVTVTVNVKDGYTIDSVEWHKDYHFTVTGDYTIVPEIDVITYDVSYNLNWGTVTVANPVTYNVETTFTLNNPTKEWYTFLWWTGTNLTEKTINVTVNSWSVGDRTYVANWKANEDTDYTVKHWYMDLNDQRDDDNVLVENLEWTTAEEVTPEFVSKDWFRNPASKKTVTIAADGNTLVEYEYYRISYEVTYDAQWNIPASQWEVTPVSNGSFKYGAEITRSPLTKAWYHFDGWLWAEIMPAENTGLVAKWTPVEVTYTVEHYKENANDNGYTQVLTDKQVLSWVTEQETNAVAKEYDWFTAQTFSQAEIKWDKTTVIKIYYDRNEYTISFNSVGGTPVDSITEKFEANLTEPTRPTKDGYTFKWWDPDFPWMMPLNWLNLTALWEANTWTKYTIKHYLQNLDGSYPDEPAYTDPGAWVTAEQTAAHPRVIAWFTAVEPVQQQTIRWDESTVVRIEYTRNEYTVTYDAQWNIPASQWQVTPVANESFKYGAEIQWPQLTKDGYRFDWWRWAETMPVWGTEWVAKWTPIEVTYTVKHLQSKANDTGYIEVESDRQTLSWTTEQQTVAEAKTYEGFTAQAVTQKEIMWDGSTVIEIKYDRNPYTLTFVTTWTRVESRNVPYGWDLNVDETSAMSGYTFLWWTPDPTNMTIPLNGLTLTAQWEVHTDTPYEVKHWQQNIANDEYTLFDTDNLSGTTDSLTEAEAKEYEGFTAKSFNQLPINWDVDNHMTVVNIYYDRNVHTVTYDSKWWTAIEGKTYKYGATIQRPTQVYKSWYTFKEWSGVVTMPDNDVTFEAIWTPNENTPYHVEHWQQNIDNDDYTEVVADKQEKAWRTDSLTEAVANPYVWFTAKPFSQLQIKWDESTVVKIYYDRNKYTISFETSTGSNVDSITDRFGAAIPTIDDPTLVWYTFMWWSPRIPETMPASDISITAQWKANDDTPYTVEHYFEDLDGNYPATTEEKDHLQWTTDTQTNIEPREVSWFTPQTIEQVNIDWDGKAVVRVEYKRNSYNVSYEYVNEVTWASALPATSGYKYEQLVTIADKVSVPWYDFVWNPWADFNMPANDVVITWTFTARNDTNYTVEYYYQQADWEYSSVATSWDVRQWTTDTKVSVKASDKVPSVEEYVFDTSAANVLSWNVNWDGSLVLKVFFKKQFTVTYSKWDKWTFGNDVHANLDYWVATPEFRWDLATQHASWYTFLKWTPSVAENVTENIEYVAQWKANEDTPYTVKYIYKWTNDGIADEIVETTYAWITDSTIDAPLSWRAWFIDPDEKPITILWNGSAKVTYVYERDKYELTYNGNGWTTPDPVPVTFGALNYTWATTTRPWYTFVEWTWDERMPVGWTTLTAVWSANTDTKYKVKYYQEQLDWSYVAIETDNLSGTTDTLAEATIKDYEWFTYNASDPRNEISWNINGDESQVLSVYYTRNSYDVSYEYLNEVTWASELPTTQSYKYEQEVTVAWLATAPWYDFAWDREWTFNMPAENVVIKWLFVARNDTPYDVEHYRQNAEDDNYSLNETDHLVWVTDTDTQAEAKTYEGFTLTWGVTQANIKWDWSTIVKIYYDRNEYTISFETSTWSDVDDITARHWKAIAEPTRPVLAWYTFMWWSSEFPETMPIWWLNLEAIWKANDDTPYTVRYVYRWTNDGIADEIVEKIYTWTTDTHVDAPLLAKDGFVDPSVQQVVILWDESAEVEYIYERTWYTLTYNSNWWTPVDATTITYGALNDKSPRPLRTWYTFVEWTWDERMPLNWTVLTAIWKANTDTRYVVKHMIEQLDGTYVLESTDELSWTTDTSVTPSVNTYEGFTAPSTQTINIDPDGNAEVVYYYTRNSYTLVIKDRDETLVNTSIKYWDVIALPEDPIWTWHSFMWWNNVPSDGLMPAHEVEITARWDVNQYTITFDTDWWSEIDPITADYGTPLVPPTIPTKDRYHFIWWDPEFPETMPAYDMVIKVIWERNGRSWWGWRSEWTPAWEHWSADEEPVDNVPDWVDPEVFDAYKWAHQHGITTMDTLELADPDGYVVRWHLAKMVVNFAVNVLWREVPAIPSECHWNDKSSAWESKEIKMYAEQSCALWVMWIYMEEFLPNKIVDRWEFGTVLSRLLWWDKYNVTDTNNMRYYEKHLRALKSEEIMTQIDNPLSRKELRKRVWVMLRRVELEEEDE